MRWLATGRRFWDAVRRRLVPPLPDSGIHAVTVDGLIFYLDFAEHTHRRIAERRAFESELTAVLKAATRPGDVVVDIGANFGWHSLQLAYHQPALRALYAYEPGRAVFALAEQSLRANQLESRVTLRRLAIGQGPGEVELKHFVGLGSVNASIYPLGDLEFEVETVEVASLDSLAADYPRAPALIKCDVEGAERDVLRGAAAVLAGQNGEPPLVFLEANYETAGMAGYFPWELIDLAATYAPYRGYVLRQGEIREMASRTALRHGDTLVLAIEAVHRHRFPQAAR